MRSIRFLQTIVLTTLSAISLAISSEQAVYSDEDHDRARRLVESGEILPLEEIMQKAERERPGRILETDLEEEKGRLIYELEILGAEGIVWKLRYDAKTGEFLKDKEEH